MKKKWISLILAAFMAVSVVILPVQATDTPTLTVGTEEGIQGQSVTLGVELTGNPGFCAARFKVEYDNTALELTGIELGDKFDSGTDLVSASSIAFYFARDKYTNGTLLKLTFKVKSSAATGKSIVGLSYANGDVCNRNEEDVNFTIVSGGVNISASSGNTDIDISHAGCSLSLDDYTYINPYFYIDYSNVTRSYIARNGGMLMFEGEVAATDATYERAEESGIIKKGLVYKDTENNKQRFFQQSTGIVPKDYDQVYTFVTYVKLEDGSYQYSSPKEYSVNAYCQTVCNDTDADATDAEKKLAEICQDMLDLGKHAKEYFELTGK